MDALPTFDGATGTSSAIFVRDTACWSFSFSSSMS
ncbi:hypothetical protein RKD47_005156 [Streptomyces albogriseolus]